MSNNEDYASLGHRSWKDIPEPTVLPKGSYRLRVRKASFKEAQDERSNDIALFVFSVVEPLDDVHEDDLAALGDNYDFSGNRIFVRQYLADSSDYRSLKTLLGKLGIAPDPNEEPAETLKSVKGQEIIAFLDQRTYKNNAGDNVTENTATGFIAVE